MPDRHATRAFAAIAVGEALPPLSRPLSVLDVIRNAFALRDFAESHHDRDFARQKNLRKDIFLDWQSVAGHVIRCATAWAGPETFVQQISLDLRDSVHAGDTLVIEGAVSSKAGDGDDAWVEIAGTVAAGAAPAGRYTLRLIFLAGGAAE